MQRALLAAGLAGLVCAVVGIFVVLKGMAFMGDAVAHSSLAGMSVAYFFGGNVFWGALAWAVPASLAITLVSRRANLTLAHPFVGHGGCQLQLHHLAGQQAQGPVVMPCRRRAPRSGCTNP